MLTMKSREKIVLLALLTATAPLLASLGGLAALGGASRRRGASCWCRGGSRGRGSTTRWGGASRTRTGLDAAMAVTVQSLERPNDRTVTPDALTTGMASTRDGASRRCRVGGRSEIHKCEHCNNREGQNQHTALHRINLPCKAGFKKRGLTVSATQQTRPTYVSVQKKTRL